MLTSNNTNTATSEELKKLLTTKDFLNIPKVEDIIKSTVISISPREILVDIPGYKTGIISGVGLQEQQSIYPDLKVGDEVEAIVLDIENEEGFVELSFHQAGQTKVWDDVFNAKQAGKIVEVKVVDANRGGLMCVLGRTAGFLPVSQLAPEHYPRVPGGDKSKILDKLRSFTDQTLRVKVLDADPKENKLIFSEKALWEEEQREHLAKYKVGDVVEGTVTAVTDFGVFVSFDDLEGLVHISEIAWQRIDNPADLVKVGDHVRAQVLSIQGSKIFLSMKAIVDDPWKRINDRYQAGQVVKGRVLKVNPFGLFVELDPEIHGLAHVSELVIEPGMPIEEQIKPGDEREFKVVSIEPENHRLGLSQKALKKEVAEHKGEEKSEATEAAKVSDGPSLASVAQEDTAPVEDVVQ